MTKVAARRTMRLKEREAYAATATEAVAAATTTFASFPISTFSAASTSTFAASAADVIPRTSFFSRDNPLTVQLHLSLSGRQTQHSTDFIDEDKQT